MQNKEILYDTIVTEYNGVPYTHGEVIYEPFDPLLRNPELPKLTAANVNFRIAIAIDDSDEFVSELVKLVQKYSY